MKKIFQVILVALTAGLVMSACGNSNRDSETDRLVSEQSTQLTEAIGQHDYTTMSSLADSMALYVDDLTPDETVSVLLAFLEIHNHAVSQGNADRDLETLRKYVDVYDIAVGANPNDMREAFARAMEINQKVDFEKAAAQFRNALADYDAVRTYGETPEAEAGEAPKAKNDSTASASNADEPVPDVTSTVRDIE